MTQEEILIVNAHRIMTILETFTLAPMGKVNISLYDKDGEEIAYSFSNIQEMIAKLDKHNIKVVNGVVVDLKGNKLTVDNADHLENKTLKEIRAGIDAKKLGGELPAFYRNTYNRFKMLVDTEQTSAPHQWMAGVTWENELVFWGYKHTSYFANGIGADNYGFITIPQANEKHGIKIKKLYANTWNLYVLYEDGDLYVMGYNGYGQLGIGNTAIQHQLVKSATQVEKLSTSSVGYHQDYNHVAILKTDGSVWLSGNNNEGQLGNGNETHQSLWVKANIPELAKDILCLGTDQGNTYILSRDGNVYASGYNGYGQLGDGSTSRSFIFKKINNISDYNVVKMVGAGGTRSGNSAYYYNFALFLTDKGRVFGVGHNGYGQLGVNNTSNQSLPIEMNYGHNNESDPVVSIFTSKGAWGSSGYITKSRKLYMTGYNSYGELGVGDTSNRSVPTFVMDNVEYVQAISSGTYSYHRTYLALKTDKSVWTWGYNGNGQIGDNSTTNRNLPVKVRFDNSDKIVQVSQGGYSSETFWSLLLEDGRVYSWGENDYQQCYAYASSSNVRVPIRTFN
jgi:alpha-tubulin suppressor-like RCC1 family protein